MFRSSGGHSWRLCTGLMVALSLTASLVVGAGDAAKSNAVGVSVSPIWLTAPLREAIARGRTLPVAQAIVVDEPLDARLAFLATTDASGADLWLSVDGSEALVRDGRLVALRGFAQSLVETLDAKDPIAAWLRGERSLPRVGAQSLRYLRRAGSDELVMEHRKLVDVRLGLVQVQAGVRPAIQLRESLLLDGMREPVPVRLWLDALSREVLLLESILEPGRPHWMLEAVAPIVRVPAAN